MRTLAITQNITVDGAIEMLGDGFDPSAGGADLIAHNRQLSERCDALLVGRRTFEDMRGFWPRQTDDTTGVTAALDRMHKYVVSSTLGDPEWRNSTVLGADWLDRVRALKADLGGDIVVTGSITLCHVLLAEGLVDEFRLYGFPVVQGRGRRLFPDGFTAPALRTLEATSFGSGVTFVRYGT